MAGNRSRAYLVGSVDLRDRLIAELAAVGITAVAGGGVTGTGREKSKDGPRLVFVRGEPIPYGIVLTALRRCHYHRDRNEAVAAAVRCSTAPPGFVPSAVTLPLRTGQPSGRKPSR